MDRRKERKKDDGQEERKKEKLIDRRKERRMECDGLPDFKLLVIVSEVTFGWLGQEVCTVMYCGGERMWSCDSHMTVY